MNNQRNQKRNNHEVEKVEERGLPQATGYAGGI
jgi:hypothetical protein